MNVSRARRRPAALLAAPLLAVAVVAAGCGSSGGTSVAPAAPSSPAPTGSATGGPVRAATGGQDGAIAAALVTAAARTKPAAGAEILVGDRAPTTGCKQPGEPAEAASLLPERMHCGAIVDAPPKTLTTAQRAAISAAFAGAGLNVRFVTTAGLAPASPGPAVTVDRVLQPLTAANRSTVSVLARTGTAAPQVVVVKLQVSGGSWRTAG